MNPLIEKITTSKSPLNIMTHLVAGYPSFTSNLKLLKVMEKSGVSMVEIQIPFSEPIADGSTITLANQSALDKGVTLEKAFAFIEKARSTVTLPLIVMTYYNIPYQMGLEKFLKKCQALGVSGLIIPDIPFDEEREDYFKLIKSYNLLPIIVISPTTQEKRLEQIIRLTKKNQSFIYTTLKVGITGSKKDLNKTGMAFLKKIKKKLTDQQIPLAAGFGISNKNQIATVKKNSDVVVIGSYIIELFNQQGAEGVEKFLQEALRQN